MPSLRSELFKRIVHPADIAGIIIEPIQGEGGYIPRAAEFLHELRRIHEERNHAQYGGGGGRLVFFFFFFFCCRYWFRSRIAGFRRCLPTAWKIAITLQVAEITDVIDLPGWPEGTRAIARREEAHPEPVVVHRYRRSPLSGVHHRPRRSRHRLSRRPLPRPGGRARKRICETKDTGLSNLPSHSFAINAAWLTVALIAHDLLVCVKLLSLDGEMAHAEPKRLRYCLLHTAAAIARSGSAHPDFASRPPGPGPTDSQHVHQAASPRTTHLRTTAGLRPPGKLLTGQDNPPTTGRFANQRGRQETIGPPKPRHSHTPTTRSPRSP